MNKRPTDNAWLAMFEVRPIRDRYRVNSNSEWEIVNIHNNVVVGEYRDQHYAVKQARRKYKKFIKLMEKSFTSVDSSI